MAHVVVKILIIVLILMLGSVMSVKWIIVCYVPVIISVESARMALWGWIARGMECWSASVLNFSFITQR